MSKLQNLIHNAMEQGILEAIGDGVSIQDTEFRILYQNSISKRIFGDHVGSICYEAYATNEKTCEGCPLHVVFEKGIIRTTERTKNIGEETRYFEITASPLKNSDREIIAGIEIVRDVTERKNIEKELRERVLELEKFYEIAVGRELKMKALKEEIKSLRAQLSRYRTT